ncbi:hypothetical protein MMPV_003927 [Pyropia vietnamensis]
MVPSVRRVRRPALWGADAGRRPAGAPPPRPPAAFVVPTPAAVAVLEMVRRRLVGMAGREAASAADADGQRPSPQGDGSGGDAPSLDGEGGTPAASAAVPPHGLTTFAATMEGEDSDLAVPPVDAATDDAAMQSRISPGREGKLSVSLLSSTHANVRCNLIQQLVANMAHQHVVVLSLGAGGCRAPEPMLVPAAPIAVPPPAQSEAAPPLPVSKTEKQAVPGAPAAEEAPENTAAEDVPSDGLDVEDAATAMAAARLDEAAAARAAQTDATPARETAETGSSPPPPAVTPPLVAPPAPGPTAASGSFPPASYEWVSVSDVASLVSTLQSLAADRSVDYVLVDGGRADGTDTEPHVLARTLTRQCGSVVSVDALVVALDGRQALGDLYGPRGDAEAAAAAAAAVEAETLALDAGAGLQDDVSRAMRFVKLVEHANVIVVVGGEPTSRIGDVGTSGADGGGAVGGGRDPPPARESITQQLAVVLTALNAEARVVHTLGPTVDPGAVVRTGLYGSSPGLLPMWKRILAARDGEGRPLSAASGGEGRSLETGSGKGTPSGGPGGGRGASGKSGRGSNGSTGALSIGRGSNGGGEESAAAVTRPALPRAAREATFVFRAKRPFHPARLYDQIKVMTTFAGVLRSTGKLWLATRMAKPLEWNQAGDTATLRVGRPFLASVPEELWRDEDRQASLDVRWDDRWGDRETVLVFVGVRMDKAKLQGLLDSCLLQDEEMVFDHAWQSLSDPFVQWVPLATDEEDEEEEEDDDDLDTSLETVPAHVTDADPLETYCLQPAVDSGAVARSVEVGRVLETRTAAGEIAAATDLAASVATNEPAAAAAAPLAEPVALVADAAATADAPPANGVAATGVAADGSGAPPLARGTPATAGADAAAAAASTLPAGVADLRSEGGGTPGDGVAATATPGGGDVPVLETAWEAEWEAQEDATASASAPSAPTATGSAAAPRRRRRRRRHLRR